MADIFQFDESKHDHPLCIACEEMLTDAVDLTLSAADQAWFDRHIASCVECSDRFADAQRGAAWLELLKSPRPEPSADLMERILAHTSDVQHDNLLHPAIAGQPIQMPVAARGNLLSFPRLPKLAASSLKDWVNPASQPRLYMTAAMAFFSIALTLNLTGVRLDQLKASNLNPSNVRKSYYEASADAVRYYDNLRVVRVMESRVGDLRSTEDDRPTASRPASSAPKVPESQQDQKPAPRNPNGPSSRNEAPTSRPRFVTTSFLVPAARKIPAHELEGGVAIAMLSAPKARTIPVQGNALGHRTFTNQRAEGPTYVGLNIPNRPAQLLKLTQEGGLA